MTVYILCGRPHGESIWSLEGIIYDRRVAEATYAIAARHQPSALSSVEIGDVEDRFAAAAEAAGFVRSAKIDEPPGRVLMRTDR